MTTLANWALDNLHPALFGATMGALVVAAVAGASLSEVCVAGGVAGLAAFGLFAILPLAYLAWRRGRT